MDQLAGQAEVKPSHSPKLKRPQRRHLPHINNILNLRGPSETLTQVSA